MRKIDEKICTELEAIKEELHVIKNNTEPIQQIFNVSINISSEKTEIFHSYREESEE